MSCNCIKTIEEKLTEKMMEKYPGAEVVEPVEFENKTIMLDPAYPEYVLKNPTVGRVRIGKMKRKYELNMLPKYCPFCGEELCEEQR